MKTDFKEFDDRQDAATTLADDLQKGLAAAVQDKGRANLVVSGGTTPTGMFQLLRQRELPWERVRVLASDERDVPPDHADRNEAMISRELLQDKAARAQLVSLIPAGDIPGFFDELAEPADLVVRAESLADSFAKLDTRAHTASKRRIRASLIRKIRFSLPLDLLDAILLGLRGGRPR